MKIDYCGTLVVQSTNKRQREKKDKQIEEILL